MRTYTPADDDALQRYVSTFRPRHIQSLQKYGIEDPQNLAESYGNSVDFVDDHANFDVELISSTHTVRLNPIPSSPLR